MDWIETPESSSIARFKYSPANQLLVVQFNNGRTYQYRNVPGSVFNAFCNASSKGSFFNQNIQGQYQYSPI
jgi:hypothetical protein